jgi:tetratricopeptide (TPR) repeat protein
MCSDAMRQCASWLLCTVLLSVCGSADAQSVPAPSESEPFAQRSPARATIERAEKLFAAGNFDAALSEFTRAYRQLEGHPRQYYVLHNQALCHERMFRYDLALVLYERYLQKAPREEQDRRAVEAVVAALRGLLATVDIESNVRAEVWVDDRQIATAPGRVLVPAGRHLVELRASLYEPARIELNVAARQRARMRFSLRKLSAYAGLPRAYFWSGIGLTAAAVITGSVFGARALDARSEVRTLADERRDSARERERVQDLALAADACFGAAVVLAATSTVLFFATDWAEAERPARGERAVGIVVSVGAIGGRF